MKAATVDGIYWGKTYGKVLHCLFWAILQYKG